MRKVLLSLSLSVWTMCGLAPFQNLSEKLDLFVPSFPNKEINVMLMTFQPITALLMDPSVL